MYSTTHTFVWVTCLYVEEVMMPRSKQQYRQLAVVAICALGPVSIPLSAFAQIKTDAATQMGAARRLPEINLRGYGRVSGSYRAISSPAGASILQIVCADTAKAQLAQAKFLSDLCCLPGVSDSAATGRIKAQIKLISGQGAISALRSGKNVFILTAANTKDLSALIDNSLADQGTSLISRAEVDVPMYLDRWDKFGWRFYYRPWETPQNQGNQPYDPGTEFEWAKKQGQLGLVFWDDMHALDTAEGLTNEAWWDWAAAAARKNLLPVAINDSIGGNLNRFRFQTEAKMPQYLGDFYTVAGYGIGGGDKLSWSSTTGRSEALGQVQESVRHYVNDPNVVSWLEPHGELNHGPQEVFVEYGPVADAGYQTYLKGKYKTLPALNKRWFGDAGHLKNWEQVRVPEIASFMGWGPQALDLTGAWKVGYEEFSGGTSPSNWELNVYGERKVDTVPAPDNWYSPSFDDSAWPSIQSPGHDRSLFLPKRPAIYRRTFDVPSQWRSAHKRAWLYVWDLSKGVGDTVRTALNGQELPPSAVQFWHPHWMALDVTDTLKSGANSLALRLPKGYLAYRVYLSPDEPAQYPNFTTEKNAKWVDFVDWQQWSRVQTVGRGVEMIRQIDPNRNITFMHPSDYADSIKEFAENYGGEFHDTGSMGAFYADYDSLIMQGADLPFSLEPGSPASDLTNFKKMTGRYYSEGIQSVDYFIHIGDVMWHDDIKSYFEQRINMAHLIGKYHAPKAKIGVLYSNRISALTGYPWGSDPNVNLGAGYWSWNVAANLRERYDRDGLTDGDFARGSAAAYPVIVDTNTSIMDDKLVSGIEEYVRNGGTFITFVQTGRHTPEKRDAWPISRLTGYKVTHIDQLTPGGDTKETRSLALAPGQSVFNADALKTLNGAPANGLSLLQAAPDTHALLTWADGSTAVGYRQIGKGMIVQVGCKWSGSQMFDRIEPGGNSLSVQALTALLTNLMQWRSIPQIPGRIESSNDDTMMRHFVTNNGLYDVWTLWNQSENRANTADLVLAQNLTATNAIDVETGKSIDLIDGSAGNRLKAIALEPLQTRIFLTPRKSLQTAALDWFTLQRGWWRGTEAPTAAPLPAPTHRFSEDLGKGWSWKALAENEEAATIAQSNTIDPTWTKMRFGIYGIPDHTDVKRAVFRKSFTIPQAWASGRVSLWIQSWFAFTFVDRGRIWLDGKLVHDWSADGVAGEDFDGSLKPGTTHTLTVEVEGKGTANGSRGTAWLSWVPAPDASIDLAGQWSPTTDCLHYTDPITLPGAYNAFSLRRTIKIPATFAGKATILSADAPNPMVGVLINGHWVRRQHHMLGSHWDINISPWVLPGKDNEVELVCWENPGKGEVKSVSLNFYQPGLYP